MIIMPSKPPPMLRYENATTADTIIDTTTNPFLLFFFSLNSTLL